MSLALAAGAIIGSSYWVTTYRAAKQDAERDALAHANRLAEVRYGNDMAQAFEYLNKNWPDQVQSVLDRHRPQAGKPDRRDFAWYFLASMVSKPKPIELAGHHGAVNEMAIFPDRRRVASVGEDGTLRIWDVEAQTCLQTIDLGAALPGIDLSVGGLHSVAVSPDGRYVAAGADVVGICDLQRNCEVRELYRTDWNVESLCFSSDGKQIAAGVRYDHVALLSLEGDLLAKIPSDARNEVIQFLEGASQWVITNSSLRNEPRKVQFWSVDFKTLVREQFSGHPLFARLESKGDQIALAATGAIKVADMVTESMDSRGERRAPITDLAFSPDGSRVVSGHGDGMVHVHRLVIADGAIMFDGPALATHVHQGITTGVRFLDDDRLITCGTDGFLRIWPDPTPTSIVKISLPVESVWPASLGFHRKNNLVRIGADQKLIDLDSSSGEMRQFRELEFGGRHVWSDEGDHFANVNDTEFVRVLDHFAHELFHLRPRVTVHDVAFSLTESAIAIPNDDGQSIVEIRRVDDGRIHRALSAPDRVRTMAFSPDGKWLWGVLQDNTIAGWDLSQGDDQRATVLHKARSPLTTPDAFAINRAGTELATGHQDSVIRIWNLKQRDLVRQLTCIEGNPGQVLFSPDGNCLISDAGNRVAVWSLATGQLYGTVDSLMVAKVGVSPHGRQLVFLTCSEDGSEPSAIMVDLGEEFASKIQSLN